MELPGVTPGSRFRNEFTGASVETKARGQAAVAAASELLADFPVALLINS